MASGPAFAGEDANEESPGVRFFASAIACGTSEPSFIGEEG